MVYSVLDSVLNINFNAIAELFIVNKLRFATKLYFRSYAPFVTHRRPHWWRKARRRLANDNVRQWAHSWSSQKEDEPDECHLGSSRLSHQDCLSLGRLHEYNKLKIT